MRPLRGGMAGSHGGFLRIGADFHVFPCVLFNSFVPDRIRRGIMFFGCAFIRDFDEKS
jgi:hypothetical protein